MGLSLVSSTLLSHTTGQRAVLASTFCAFASLFLVYTVSVTRSLVITGAAWISAFSFFSLFSAIISLSNVSSSSKCYTFGFVRAPVLAVFSTTVLAQLSSVFLIKEAVERLLEVGHHHGGSATSNHFFYASTVANGLSLIVAAYAVTNQPFNYVLMAAQSSVMQEHAADISRALCHIVPGLSRLLLPRINSLSLLAIISTLCCTLTHYFLNEFWWFDSIAALVLSGAVFSTMMPLSTYTGRILLQTTPPHVHNQIDRCISEASTVEGVLELKNGHFWQLDFSMIAGTIDVRIRRDANEQLVLGLVTEKLSTIVSNLSVQVFKDITTTWGSGIASVLPATYLQHYGSGVGQHASLMSPHLTSAVNNVLPQQHNHSHNNYEDHQHGSHYNGHSHGSVSHGHSHDGDNDHSCHH